MFSNPSFDLKIIFIHVEEHLRNFSMVMLNWTAPPPLSLSSVRFIEVCVYSWHSNSYFFLFQKAMCCFYSLILTDFLYRLWWSENSQIHLQTKDLTMIKKCV